MGSDADKLEAHSYLPRSNAEIASASQAISLQRIADKMALLVSLVEMVVSDMALADLKNRVAK